LKPSSKRVNNRRPRKARKVRVEHQAATVGKKYSKKKPRYGLKWRFGGKE